MSDLVDRRLGQYELRELIRQGGMATVYKAYQPSLDRWVAVKVLARPDDATFVARFEAEARSIARFQHPNIVPVHDYGEQDGYLYLVVTYVEGGRSLAELVGGRMAADRALRFGVQILAGLAYAHGKGVVHRDVKPSNVLLPSPDWSMLADFGIAKLLHGQGRDLTRPGSGWHWLTVARAPGPRRRRHRARRTPRSRPGSRGRRRPRRRSASSRPGRRSSRGRRGSSEASTGRAAAAPTCSSTTRPRTPGAGGPGCHGRSPHAALVSTGTELFVIGGYAGSTTRPVSTVRRLDQAASRWVDAPPLPVAVGAGAAAWDGRRIVYAGGVGANREPSSSVFVFENGAWRRLGALSRVREHLAAASDGRGTTYFLAGEVNRGGAKTVLNTVDAVEGDTVRLVGFVPTARGSVAGFFSPHDGACVGGGRDRPGGFYAEVECIGPDGVTSQLPNLQTPRHGLGMVVIRGSVYALLGSDDRGRTFRTGEVLRLAS